MKNNTTIALASDHAGYKLKRSFIAYLEKEGIQYADYGCLSEESCDYADFAHPLANAVANSEFAFGISICGSGNGINMTVNKHAGIRSALCWNVEIAKLARGHNDANICAIPTRFVSTKDALSILQAFLNTSFEGDRHLGRIKKIESYT